MKNVLPNFLLLLLLSSCASVFNSQTTKVTLHTVSPSRIVFNNDTIPTSDNQVKIKVYRKQQPLVITTITDTLTKEYQIASKNSTAYYSNIFFNYGLGMLVDMDNPKRFTYPSHVFLNPKDSIVPFIKKDYSAQKGSVFLHFGIPYINNLIFQPEGEGTKSSGGFLGITLGLDYYHSEKQYLNFSTGVATDFPVFIPVAYDYEGYYEFQSSANISFSNNHILNRFSVGYGLAYARNMWDLREGSLGPGTSPSDRTPVFKANNTLGLVFPAYYRLGNRFHLGINYKPSLFDLDSGGLQYEHVISLELVWKLRVKK